MTMALRWTSAAMLMAGLLLGVPAPAGAAGLQPGEYACAGSGGTILIGLGFRLRADGSYTDLDGKSAGRVVFDGSNVRFVGGHLDGEVGRNVRGNNFEIHSASCSHN